MTENDILKMYLLQTRGCYLWRYMKTRPEVSEGGPQETIVLRCNKLNPESTEIFEIKVKNLYLSGTSVPKSQECVHKNSERYFI